MNPAARHVIRKTAPVVAATVLAGLTGCACGRQVIGLTGGSSADAVRRVLDRQVRAWNDGDVDGFMDGYWRSDDLRFFSGAEVTRGWQATLDRYERRYPDRRAMGHLTFDHLEFDALGDDAMLVAGRWHLERDEPTGGLFSLVFRRVDGRWVIVHDHTSADAG